MSGSDVIAAESADYQNTRAEAEKWLRQAWNPDCTLAEWWAVLADSGWGFPSWPAGRFGRGLDPGLAGAVARAFEAVGAPGPPTSVGQVIGVPVLLRHGTSEQQDRYIPRLARGEEYWCELFSEPGAGSDPAAVQTRAVRDGTRWIVTGQKVWNTGAQYAAKGILLARTDFDVPKHDGLTVFLLDMDKPGIEIRPIRQMNEKYGFNEVFLSEISVDEEDMLGTVNGGWSVALSVLSLERSHPANIGPEPGLKVGLLNRRAGDVARGAVRGPEVGFSGDVDVCKIILEALRGSDRVSDPVIRNRAARLYGLAEVLREMQIRQQRQPRVPGEASPLGSMIQLLRSRLGREGRDLGAAILGRGLLESGPAGTLAAEVLNIALTSPAWSIGGGTDEIQRNIIGERVLGLPREPRADKGIPFRDVRVGSVAER
jgi:alkylation response protein AidB-like acyl-CoA dehydrogenase